jgi:uncharacterized protein YceK
MRTWRVWAAAVAVLPVLGGCGTLSNITDQAPAVRAYGGVQRDWMLLTMAQEDDSGIMWAFVPALAVDLPLSVVGDTLTLPYTALTDPTLFRKSLVHEPQDFGQEAAGPSENRSAAPPATPAAAK